MGGGEWRVLVTTHGAEGVPVESSRIELKPDQALILESSET
jgi:hypothetical protein